MSVGLPELVYDAIYERRLRQFDGMVRTISRDCDTESVFN